MSSTLVNRRDILAAIAFTTLVASIGAVGAYSASKYWPGTHGIASGSAAIRLALFAILLGNLFALIIVGVVLGYKRALHRESPPIFGVYVTVVNVIVAFLLWIIPQLF